MQHADLAGALVDRQQQRVDDAEERDQDAHSEQGVDQPEERVRSTALTAAPVPLGAAVAEPPVGISVTAASSLCNPSDSLDEAIARIAGGVTRVK
jgi:hypothetical protein